MAIPSILAGGGLDTPAPHLSNADARQIALVHYGLSGDFKRFATEKDDTFRITTQSGQAYVLKIANPAEEPGEIDLQIALLDHLEQRDGSIPCPRVIADMNGKKNFFYTAPDGTERIVRLLTYLDGTPLDGTESSATERKKIGNILARLRLALAGFTHPAQNRKLAWDIQHLHELAPLLEEIPDHTLRSLLSEGLDRFKKATHDLAQQRRQVLHNDFSRSNLVVDHSAAEFVTGVIDFGDAVETAIVIDVSTALLNQLPRTATDDPFAAGRDILRGYLSVADLTASEMDMLPHLIMGRVIARALLSLWRAQIFPQNAEYILRNTEQGWWQLKWFATRSDSQLRNELQKFQ